MTDSTCGAAYCSIGISPCPNDVFIFAGLLLNAVAIQNVVLDFRFEDVETLNALARSGELDIAKISYANLAHCSDRYEALECGGALGRGCGPLLLTNGIAFDANRRILSPGEFTTANFLLDFYLHRPLDRVYLPFDELYRQLLEQPGSQGVVIHEKRFTFERDGLTLVCDLGQYWEEQTGAPIPLGAIVTRRNLQIADEISAAIRTSLSWAYANEAAAFELCRQYAQDLDPAVIRSHIDLYVNEFSRDLGAEGRRAVDALSERQRARR